jgi:hypothetical protein
VKKLKDKVVEDARDNYQDSWRSCFRSLTRVLHFLWLYLEDLRCMRLHMTKDKKD